MKISKDGIEFLKQLEGVKGSVYLDNAGLKTIGVGHLLTYEERKTSVIYIAGIPVDYSHGLTPLLVDELLMQDIKRFEEKLNKYNLKLSQNQFDALVCFMFNIGISAFQNSTLLCVLIRNDYKDVPNEMRRWNKAGGKTINGLSVRREKEIELWLKN